MLREMKLGSQLATAFSAILIIVLINGLQQGFSNFKEYRGLAKDTNLAGRLQANMLMVRLNALKYISNDSPEVLAALKKRNPCR